MIRNIIILFLCFPFLFSCSAMQAQNEQSDQERKESTARINVQLGLAYLDMHRVEEAKQKLLTAINEAPEIPEPWYSMGYFQESTGDIPAAQRNYLKALSIAPNRGDVQNNYGTFLCRQQDYPNAIAHFEMAVRDPNYLSPGDAFENAGLCAKKIPDSQLAMHYFSAAIKHDPERPISLLELAKLEYDRGDYSLAKKRLDQYLQIASATDDSNKLLTALEKKLNDN